MRLDGYVRVSRVAGRGGESFISPRVQREQIAAYAKARGFKIGQWHEDMDVSGGTLKRPGLRAALERCAQGDSDGIIAAKLDRLTRSLGGLAQLIELAQAEGWTLVAVDLGLDLHTPGGKLVGNVLGAVAQWELEQRRASWGQAQAEAVRRGIHIASRTPTGYAKGADGRLVPDAKAAPAVRELFLRRARGEGWTALARYLEAAGVVGPYGSPTWTAGAVMGVIRNRVYLGEARSGRYSNPEAHAPLVNATEWDAAQGTGYVHQPRKGEGYMLQGIVRCASCRYIMKADTMRGRDGERLGIYRCRGRHAAGQCPAPATVMARVLDPYIEEQFLAALGPHGPLAEAMAVSAAVEAAADALDQAEAELVAYRDEPLIASTLGAAEFAAGLQVRVEAVEEAQAALAEARQHGALLGPLTPGSLVEAWPELSTAERRRLLTASLDAIVVRPARGTGRAVPPAERTLVVWRGEAPADLPRRGNRVPLAPYPWPGEPPAGSGVAIGEDAKPRRRKLAAR